MDWQDEFDAMLDEEQPKWFIALADNKDLQDFAQGWVTETGLKTRIRNKLCHVIRVAAIIGKKG